MDLLHVLHIFLLLFWDYLKVSMWLHDEYFMYSMENNTFSKNDLRQRPLIFQVRS